MRPNQDRTIAGCGFDQILTAQRQQTATDEGQQSPDLGHSPIVIRRKEFTGTPMSVDDALYHMELVGHPFYLFLDVETGKPSVVYSRKGWKYGVITLA